MLLFLLDNGETGSESQPKIVMSEELKDKESYPDSDKLYFTKQHLKEALKDFRDKFHDEKPELDDQEISRIDAGIICWIYMCRFRNECLNRKTCVTVNNCVRLGIILFFWLLFIFVVNYYFSFLVKKKFRSIEEIRKELEDHMGMKVKSDAQIMKIKVDLLRAENSTELEQANALEDLEYYVHQIDNAVDLEKMHGLEVVINYLNHSIIEMQEKAAKVIGAAVQRFDKKNAFMTCIYVNTYH